MSRNSSAPLIEQFVKVATRAAKRRWVKMCAVVLVGGWLTTMLVFGQAQSSNYSSSPLPGVFNSPVPTAPGLDPASYAILHRTTHPTSGRIITSWVTSTPQVPRRLSSSLGHRLYLPLVENSWSWATPGFGGGPSEQLVSGISNYSWYGWNPYCDYPSHHQIPMIWGWDDFYNQPAVLDALFNGPCNDTRPLLFLNEPAGMWQANIPPGMAADMFYTMTRGLDWPRARWRGPIYVGNNLIEAQEWDASFVRAFAAKHNAGSTRIPEIAGWGVHLYGNYEYGDGAGTVDKPYTRSIPAGDIPLVVDRSVNLVNRYLAARTSEGNSTSILVTEFGQLQASWWHNPPQFYYDNTVGFMGEYVRRFDTIANIQTWFWFVSYDSGAFAYNTDSLYDEQGNLTPNGVRWRELAKERQSGGY